MWPFLCVIRLLAMIFMKMKEYYFIALIIKVIDFVSSEWEIYESYGATQRYPLN